jgi:hypothetical protein
MLACLINGNYRSYPIAVTQNVEEWVYENRQGGVYQIV